MGVGRQKTNNGRECDREALSLGRNKRVRQMIDDACGRANEAGGASLADILREIPPKPARKTRNRRQHG